MFCIWLSGPIFHKINLKPSTSNQVQTVSAKYGWIDIAVEVEKATDIKIAGIQEIMNGCELSVIV